MTKVFIDGSAGTTGLKIYDRLTTRDDISLVTVSEELRKDAAARKDAMNSSDVVFLCLPDAAAMEAAGFVENERTVVIDTSTAHRTADDWTYGFAELKGQREKIRTAKRIANPGCHASGFISLVAPLTDADIITPNMPLSCFSLTGYSGGGKKMIAEYKEAMNSTLYAGTKEAPATQDGTGDADDYMLFSAPRMYGLQQTHKHLPEMMKLCGLKKAPAFCPIVGDFYSGMEVVITLFDNDIEKIKDIYRGYYGGREVSKTSIRFAENADENGLMSAAAFSGRDDMQISVQGNNERILLVSRFDNLGKGASGAAIQNMNIALGLPEDLGLIV